MKNKNILLALSLLLFLTACQAASGAPVIFPGRSATSTPFFPELDSEEAPTATLESLTLSFWINPVLPTSLLNQLELPSDWEPVEGKDQALFTIDLAEDIGQGQWVYALVAPFSTVLDEVAAEDLEAAWNGAPNPNFDGAPLLLSEETLALFSALWGQPAAGAVQVEAEDQLLKFAWSHQPSWALIPFESLEPQWKVLSIDGQSPVQKEFRADLYALSVPIVASGDFDWPALGNRDPAKMTTVVLTGVTALVRATAYEMNRSGILYPAEDIGPLLASADITHISNEVPFWSECPSPDPVQRNLVFCSDPAYYALLEEVGTDIMELTGDHFNDYGQQATLYTLDLYDEHNLPYYGGGRNAEDARAPKTFEHNGNRIAFIGCNGKGGGYATASENSPGAVGCDYQYLAEEIGRLHDEGFLVITTFQHDEVYTFIPQPGLVRDFTLVAEAGSSIVSGSQAHQSHGFEFTDADTLITYGLGNLFFDQKGIIDYGDEALIARHVFYDGRYISTEIFTIFFVDFAKPRFMTALERAEFLSILFNASRFESLLSQGS